MRATIGSQIATLDQTDPTVRAAMARLREECVAAKETLSEDSETTISVMLPGVQSQVRLTRQEFEDVIRPPVRETVDATLTEVARCTRDGITINTFMLDPTPHLRSFVERLTEMNKGRAFFTTPDTLGDYVLVDFIEHRRALLKGRRAS